MALAPAHLESLLRARQLDRTLTTALPPLDPRDEYALGSTGVTALDAKLGGGFPRGQLSEIVGSRASGGARPARVENWWRSSMRSTCSMSNRSPRPASILTACSGSAATLRLIRVCAPT